VEQKCKNNITGRKRGERREGRPPGIFLRCNGYGEI
jgi:hypothetical protein